MFDVFKAAATLTLRPSHLSTPSHRHWISRELPGTTRR